ncbi:MAG TPA: phospho-N-acetylmuramoyl-pentapeptide-transferase [Thermoanaerobaculia bacterium]|jgi:phospho-N-acetylmuramoyl-pentapeptide-transferase|nr:phospho-N-acetylmuramoyl-pentapeptide-transferase [Thermoanaerobaculia bacterium]
MLYWLLYPLRDVIPAFNVFRYITFRVVAAMVAALILSWILGPWFIRQLRRLSVGQNIRDVGPQAHQVKAGTPTMGGLLILFATMVPTLLFGDLRNIYVWLVVIVTTAFGAIGFADDYLKVRNRRNLGLTARAKFLLQVLVGLAFGIALLVLPAESGFNPAVTFPFIKRLVLHLGYFYIPFVAFVLVGSSNAVNLTDGLDGLAIGATSVAAATYAVFTYVAGNAIISRYLQVSWVPGVGEVAVFCGAMVGAGIGFLWFNSHPAEVFMGDVGSLSLGAAIGSVAVIAKQEILLVLVGGLFVMEALSVIIQVASFKLRGKRVFRMSPLHHHFELSGWAEPKVIVRFWILSILFALLSLSTLKLR